MNSVQKSPQYISLLQLNQELQAENQAKKNEIDTLYKEIERITNRDIVSTVTGVLVQNPCQKCSSLKQQINELQESLRKVNLLRSQQKNEYEAKIRYYSQRTNHESNSRVYRAAGGGNDFDELRKSQESLKTKIEQLRIEKNRKIEQLERVLISLKTENEKQRIDYEIKIKNLEHQQRNTAISQNKNSYSGLEESLNSKIKELTRQNEQLQRKNNELILRTKQPAVKSTRYHDSDYERVKEQNKGLLDKVQFIEKRLYEVEGWNKILKEEILMKMHRKSSELEQERISMRQTLKAEDEIVRLSKERQSPEKKIEKIEYLRIDNNEERGNQKQINKYPSATTTNGFKVQQQGRTNEVVVQTRKNYRIFKSDGSQSQQNNNQYILANKQQTQPQAQTEPKGAEKSSSIGTFFKKLFKDQKNSTPGAVQNTKQNK